MADEYTGGRTVSAVYEKATLVLAGILVTLVGSMVTLAHDSIPRAEVDEKIREIYAAMDKRDQQLSDRLARIEQSQSQMGQDVARIAGGILLINRSLYQFSKIPFTCSWLPPGPHLKMRLGVKALVFVLLAGALAQLELWSLEQPVRFAVVLATLIGLAIWASRRSTEFAASPGEILQFDDLPPAEIFALDLSREADKTSDDSYLDAAEMYNRT